VIVDLVGFGIVMPTLPYWAREFGASGATLGLLITGYAAAQFVFAPIWGRLSDRIGRRPVLLATVAGTALALFGLAVAPSLAWLFAARVLAGAFAANVGVASAYIADVTPPEERTRWMGLLGASFGIGFVLGPAIGGALAPFGYQVPLFAAAGLAAANLVHAVVALREPPGRIAAAVDGAARAGALKNPLVRQLCIANFAFSIGVTQLETIFGLFMIDRFHYGLREFAWILAGMAVLMGGIQGGGMKALSARFGERALVVGGSAILALGFATVPPAPTVGALLLPLALCALGRALLQPSLMSLVSIAAGADQRGSVMGAFQASASLARVVGPIVAGVLYDWSLGAPFFLAAALSAFVAFAGRSLPQTASDVPGGAALAPPGV
jgi:DHA1 family tetracycline resistance protein-like MFS transporter